MLKNFKSSPLWMIGLFIIFAEATAIGAAIKLEGWVQGALVIFVISYSSVVTLAFFLMLCFRPWNFYTPSEYAGLSPESFVKALSGLPSSVRAAVNEAGAESADDDSLFSLIDSLIIEADRQHLILMRRQEDQIDVSTLDDYGFNHHFEIFTRQGGMSMGAFDPRKFCNSLNGTDLVRISGTGKKILLTSKGQRFADWLIDNEKDAETFKSDLGRWGKEQSVSDFFDRRGKESAEDVGAVQPATAPDSKPEDEEKPKPKPASEVRHQ